VHVVYATGEVCSVQTEVVQRNTLGLHLTRHLSEAEPGSNPN